VKIDFIEGWPASTPTCWTWAPPGIAGLIWAAGVEMDDAALSAVAEALSR